MRLLLTDADVIVRCDGCQDTLPVVPVVWPVRP